ncbi:MAG: methyltransferase, partial [Ramlibacter sp.]|nr:methyltransferase [Ramlibacter sp.]
LRLGGVLYISYNVLPGWSAQAPVRHLLAQHAAVMGAPGENSVQRVNASLEFCGKVLEHSPFRAQLQPLLDSLAEQNRHYLAHEYFNRDWAPMHFSDMANWLTPAKLNYAGSAQALHNLDTFDLRPDQRELLAGIGDPLFRETVRDYLVNRRFRTDLWVKGARRLSPAEVAHRWDQQQVQLLQARDQVTLTLDTAQGKLQLLSQYYEPVLDLLADLRPHAVAELRDALRDRVMPNDLHEVLAVLHGRQQLALVQNQAQQEAVSARCQAFNQYMRTRAMTNGDIACLLSPATGGCFTVGRLPQVFMEGWRKEALRDAEQLADYAWNILQPQGQRMMRDGQVLEAEADNLQELRKLAEAFLNELPRYQALQLV